MFFHFCAFSRHGSTLRFFYDSYFRFCYFFCCGLLFILLLLQMNIKERYDKGYDSYCQEQNCTIKTGNSDKIKNQELQAYNSRHDKTIQSVTSVLLFKANCHTAHRYDHPDNTYYDRHRKSGRQYHIVKVIGKPQILPLYLHPVLFPEYKQNDRSTKDHGDHIIIPCIYNRAAQT